MAFGPKEECRVADEGGKLVCYRSYISDNLLLSGSRRTGPESKVQNQVGQRKYLITEEGAEVSLLRSGLAAQDTRDLFRDNRAGLSRIEKRFYTQFEDQNLIPVPSPS